MQYVGGHLRLSATDLVGHLKCKALTEFSRAVALGERARPFRHDPMLEVLRERGSRHETAYVAHLEASGLAIITIPGSGVDEIAVAATLAAMRAGTPVIVQAALRDGDWVGRADVLRRVDTASDLGLWSYEPLDTKLARETKAGSVLQLCLYAELLKATQGVAPEYAHVVAPWSDFVPLTYRVADYAAYFRQVKASLEADLLAAPVTASYPEPVEHCDVCAWSQQCDGRRRADDHLSLVAGLTKSQALELRSRGIGTLASLAVEPLPLSWRPGRGSAESIGRGREQARIQLEGRSAGVPRHELLDIEPKLGLCRLPEPSAGDIFLDLEGDPFVGEGGLEYLFGYTFADDAGVERYTGDWALERQGERAAFERFIDFATARLELHPDLHIYHFAPYEPAALKRLMGRYATRSEALDQLLRAQVFVDLYAVVRQGLRASVESYSIKRLEPFYGFVRRVPLPDANRALADLQAGLELGDAELLAGAKREVVEGYNRDDCFSTWRLRDWLEAQRAQAIEAGCDVPRPEPTVPDPPEDLAAWLARIEPIMARLLEGVPDDPTQRTPAQQGRWLLANFLDWHRQENKATWWEYFRLRDLSAEDLLEERSAVSGLAFETVVGGTAKAPIQRYRFPPQETQLRGEEDLRAAGGETYGKVVAVSIEDRWIDIKKMQKSADVHATAVFAHRSYPIGELQESLLRLGEHVAGHGIEGHGPYQAARDLLLRRGPPLPAGVLSGDDVDPEALVLALGPGVLPIQGPPGAGKTFTGARMICRLVEAGRTVAVTANSHKVIRHLLDEVVGAARALNVPVRCLQKPDDLQDDLPGLVFVGSNPAVFAAIGSTCDVAGGTPWLWAREEAIGAVDVLVVDEAAQMSLANVLAVAPCARTVILLGDPQQLDQPLQGSHPEGTDVSALRHLLGPDHTIAPDRGLFLAETWRLHPDICRFTSELFYGDRLRSKAGLERQEVRGAAALSGAGLRFLAVPHRGNQNVALEEAEAIGRLLDAFVGAATWIDSEGAERVLGWDDVLLMAPYNAQVFELQRRLPNARVGTVDKFQGQQAPLVVYSMTTSSQADAPRGLEFLYSLNRLNVATSRAKAVSVVVGSPELLAAECRTPRQMQLVNGLCRYAELATWA